MITFTELKNTKYGDIGWNILYNNVKVGIIAAKVVDHDNKKCLGFSWIHIAKQHRKKGYGKKAVKLMIDLMKKKHKCFIALSVGGPDKKVADAFWKSLGFINKNNDKNKNYILIVK